MSIVAPPISALCCRAATASAFEPSPGSPLVEAAIRSGADVTAELTAIVAASLPEVTVKSAVPALPCRSLPAASCVFVAEAMPAASVFSLSRYPPEPAVPIAAITASIPASCPEVMLGSGRVTVFAVFAATRLEPPKLTSIEPSCPAAPALWVTVVLPSAESWSIRLSRWSSRSFGCAPASSAAWIDWLSAATWVPIELTCPIVSVSFWLVCDWIVVSWFASVLIPFASDEADSTSAVRVAMSLGAFATSCQDDQYLESSAESPLSDGSASDCSTCESPDCCAW